MSSLQAARTWTDSKDAEIDHNDLGLWRETIVLRRLGGQRIKCLGRVHTEVNLARLLFSQ